MCRKQFGMELDVRRWRHPHICYWALVAVLLIVICTAGFSLGDSSSQTCSTEEAQQFVVVIHKDEPLGLRLSDRLEILEFVSGESGRSRAVEASGLAEIGDLLIQVNNDSLVGTRLQDAVVKLRTASLPKTLRFKTHDGRCQQPTSTSDVNAPVFDYIVLSVGDKDTELKLYAVLSADGKPPSCSFRELTLAQPFDACMPLTVNVTDKYVLVPDIFGCPAHQKAGIVQEGGAKGVVFVQYAGEKPLQVRVPAELPKPIQIPLVMVSMDSGVQILEQMNAVRPYETLQLRFVFSSDCEAEKFAVHPGEDPYSKSTASLVDMAVAGFLSVTTATSATAMYPPQSYEFLKPADQASDRFRPKLPLGKVDLYFPDPTIFKPCDTDPTQISPFVYVYQDEMKDCFVVVQLQQKGCSVYRQLVYFAAKGVLGVIFGDPEFPSTANSLMAVFSSQQIAIPFVFISMNAFTNIRQNVDELNGNNDVERAHVQGEFTGENALYNQWTDLAGLANVKNWPSLESARNRLFHRILKDHAAVKDQDAQLALVQDERYEALVTSYWRAQKYYASQKFDGQEQD